MGTLFIVATPIGNLKDLSFRAVEILEAVEFIVCEDTRRSTILLNFIEKTLQRPFVVRKRPHLLSYHEEREWKIIPEVVQILKNGASVAFVSDAGTPTVSDPGFKLVRECIKEKIPVVPIPGASSVLSALVVSGLPTDKFLFIGFLPHKDANRKKMLMNIAKSLDYVKSTVILFEAPHRLLQTLSELKEELGDIEVVIARELTKIHEEIRRETISLSVNHFSSTQPRGEFVILFNLGTQNGGEDKTS